MQGRETEIYNLSKILIYSVNSLFSCGTYPRSEIINNLIYLSGRVSLRRLKQNLEPFDQLMSTGSEVAHSFALRNYSIIIVFTLL